MHRLARRSLCILVAALVGGAPVPAGSDMGDEHRNELEEAMRGLLEQFGPAVEELRALLTLFAAIDSLEFYEAPRIMPNGDILIRRRADAPPRRPVPAPDHRPHDAPPEAGPTPGSPQPWVDL